MTTTVYSKSTDSHVHLHADSCNKTSSTEGIQKDFAPRLRRSCSSGNDYTAKSKECTKCLANRGHDLKSVQQCFNNVGKTFRHEARKKEKPEMQKS